MRALLAPRFRRFNQTPIRVKLSQIADDVSQRIEPGVAAMLITTTRGMDLVDLEQGEARVKLGVAEASDLLVAVKYGPSKSADCACPRPILNAPDPCAGDEVCVAHPKRSMDSTDTRFSGSGG